MTAGLFATPPEVIFSAKVFLAAGFVSILMVSLTVKRPSFFDDFPKINEETLRLWR